MNQDEEYFHLGLQPRFVEAIGHDIQDISKHPHVVASVELV
jgi:hypothetical protein